MKITQTINVALLDSLHHKSNGHSTVKIEAEVDSQDERIRDMVKDATFTLLLPDPWTNPSKDLSFRYSTRYSHEFEQGMLITHSTPKVEIEEAS